jgi:hypothetical protein
VEFEISRADPVANHAKFATARFFEDAGAADAFVSMPSRHIVTGRAALAAGTAMMMRALGFPAFQVDLLPTFDGPQIKQMNALPLDALREQHPLDVAAEIDRVLEVTDATIVSGWHRIHCADNSFTVSVNVRQWNRELSNPANVERWGSRPVQFFVHDAATGLFAPSKYCAFVPAPERSASQAPFRSVREPPGGMTLDLYLSLGERDPRFDGHVARKHLERRLGYRVVPLAQADASMMEAFGAWHRAVAQVVPLRRPVCLLVRPLR